MIKGRTVPLKAWGQYSEELVVLLKVVFQTAEARFNLCFPEIKQQDMCVVSNWGNRMCPSF